MLPKIRVISKKASNKSCLQLNFAQKSPRARMSFSTRSGARGYLLSLYQYISKSFEIHRSNDNILQSVSLIEHCSQSIEYPHLGAQYVARVS